MGDMSISALAPHAETYRRLFEADPPVYDPSLPKPGITGWAQINGYRGETRTVKDMNDRVQYDLWYLRELEPWLDTRVIFPTVFNTFRVERTPLLVIFHRNNFIQKPRLGLSFQEGISGRWLLDLRCFRDNFVLCDPAQRQSINPSLLLPPLLLVKPALFWRRYPRQQYSKCASRHDGNGQFHSGWVKGPSKLKSATMAA